ncbi:MAG: RluA family pseudouridine synthase [Bacilli bacterium]
MNEITVVLENEERIDKYLPTCLKDITRSELKKYFDDSLIKVNDKVVKPSFKVKNGDVITIEEYVDDLSNIEPENIPLDIIYEDDDIIVINKPSGMVVHPAPGHSHGTLVNALMYHYNTLSNINGEHRAGIVHRIDKDTSGLLIVCKTNYAHRIISDELKNKVAKRTYVAIVTGSIGHNLGKIDAPIGRDPSNRQKMAIVAEGKHAVTHFKVLDRFRNFTLLELELETGRTHQIRVHMAYINHPVLGDPLYGVKKQVEPFGQYLHAKKIGFIHPRTNKYMEFEVPLPKEFQDKINELKEEEKK